jgi:hypothetical protein
MEPTQETQAAVERLSEASGDLNLLDRLMLWSQVAQSLVPSTLGLSITVVMDGEPFTLTVTREDLAEIDAAQYIDGGPCVASSDTADEVVVADVLDERRWQLFATTAHRLGVRSSLSMPLGGSDPHLPGAINIYAADPAAFAGRERVLAAVFRVPAQELVHNADLSFMTLDFARQLPHRLEEKAKVDRAVGVLQAVYGWSAEEARRRLTAAAGQAGLPAGRVADIVTAVNESD